MVYANRYGSLKSNLTNCVKLAKYKNIEIRGLQWGDKPNILQGNKDGNFVSAADVWNPKKLEELFTRLNPNRKLRLERERLGKGRSSKTP